MARRLATFGCVCVAVPSSRALASDSSWAPAPAPVVATAAPVAASTALGHASRPVAINIDGHLIATSTPPVETGGDVFVPLRGVLESLDAKVDYNAADRRIEIHQADKFIILRNGLPGAAVNGQAVDLPAPRSVNGATLVPLRALAELFGDRVSWLAGSRTLAIYTPAGANPLPADHREALAAGGAFGIGVDVSDVLPNEVPKLLDAVQAANAGLVKIRFDWNTLEPVQGADYQWPIFDRVVQEARRRHLVVVGVLGDSAQWASRSDSTSVDEWRNCPPRDDYYPDWSNYVKRVVGRYKNDVHAWQVWENPDPNNFHSIARTYRILTRLAVLAARDSDPKAILHAAEPGGVGLDFITDLQRNGVTRLVDGIALYPVSQWQPGALNPVENILLPSATLREKLTPRDGRAHDYWVGGLSFPALDPAVPFGGVAPVALGSGDVAPGDGPADTPQLPARPGLETTFSPAAQAAYLVRSMALDLASGSGKVFWSRLRDARDQEPLQPINPNANTGLMRYDNSHRPAFAAFKAIATQLAGKDYVGNLAMGPDLVALVFAGKDTSTLVAWSPRGAADLKFKQAPVAPAPDAAALAANAPLAAPPAAPPPDPGTTSPADAGTAITTPAPSTPPAGPDPTATFVPGVSPVLLGSQGQILSDTGATMNPDAGQIHLTTEPVFLTHLVPSLVKLAESRSSGAPLEMPVAAPAYSGARQVQAIFGLNSVEDGLYWHKYAGFGGQAEHVTMEDTGSGLTTEAQRNIFDLKSSRPFIYLDVADDFLYYARGVPVTVTVTVHRPQPDTAGVGLLNDKGGFKLEYDSASGFKSTEWRPVDAGTGWATFVFHLPDANFSDEDGYDLLVNAGGSKVDLVFGSVTVERDDAKGGVIATTSPPSPPITPESVAPAPPTAGTGGLAAEPPVPIGAAPAGAPGGVPLAAVPTPGPMAAAPAATTVGAS